MSIPPALAGHAGEMGVTPLMPHELMGGLTLLALLVLSLLVVQGLSLWRLRRLERRLHRIEQALEQGRPNPSAGPPANPSAHRSG